MTVWRGITQSDLEESERQESMNRVGWRSFRRSNVSWLVAWAAALYASTLASAATTPDFGELSRADFGKLSRADFGELSRADFGELGRADFGELGRAVTGMTKDADGITLHAKPGTLRLRVWGERVLRVT